MKGLRSERLLEMPRAARIGNVRENFTKIRTHLKLSKDWIFNAPMK
jgi:hypothetical protein